MPLTCCERPLTFAGGCLCVDLVTQLDTQGPLVFYDAGGVQRVAHDPAAGRSQHLALEVHCYVLGWHYPETDHRVAV